MRVVLDTNIFVSGIHWDGNSRKILNAWLDMKLEVIISFDIIEEITRTLKNFRIPLVEHDIELWESLLLETSFFVFPEDHFDVVKNDADDNKFVDAAVEGHAQFIISQDKHLLNIKEFGEIKVVHPNEFVQLLK